VVKIRRPAKIAANRITLPQCNTPCNLTDRPGTGYGFNAQNFAASIFVTVEPSGKATAL
jgi:hypothetical protein